MTDRNNPFRDAVGAATKRLRQTEINPTHVQFAQIAVFALGLGVVFLLSTDTVAAQPPDGVNGGSGGQLEPCNNSLTSFLEKLFALGLRYTPMLALLAILYTFARGVTTNEKDKLKNLKKHRKRALVALPVSLLLVGVYDLMYAVVPGDKPKCNFNLNTQLSMTPVPSSEVTKVLTDPALADVLTTLSGGVIPV